MANFDSNHWYQVYVNERTDWSLRGPPLGDNEKTRTAYFEKTRASNPTNRFQIYPINSTTFVLRTQAAGPDVFLGTTYFPDEPSTGHTRVVMMSNDIADPSVYWTAKPWGDGTFFLTNGANGTAWNLKKKTNDDFVTIDSNIAEPSRGQRWNFNGIDDVFVNDQSFSDIALPFTSSTSSSLVSTATSTELLSTASSNGISSTAAPNELPTASSEPGSTNPSFDSGSDSGGLSTGAKVGIGIGAGGFALVAFGILALLWWRKRQQQSPNRLDSEATRHELSGISHYAPTGPRFEKASDYAAKYEMPATPAQAPVELPSNEVGPKHDDVPKYCPKIL